MTTVISPHRQRGALLACGALLATLVLASACGDSGDGEDQPSKTETWAGQVCSTASNWLGAVSDAEATLTDTTNLDADALRGAFDDIAGATETLVTNLGQLGTPDTEAGDEAQAQLSSLSDQLQQQQGAISSATDQAAGSVQGLLAQVSTVTTAVATMLSDIGKAIDNIRQLQGADELEKAFQDASACQELRASASPSA
jgi:hypothetical protein